MTLRIAALKSEIFRAAFIFFILPLPLHLSLFTHLQRIHNLPINNQRAELNILDRALI